MLPVKANIRCLIIFYLLFAAAVPCFSQNKQKVAILHFDNNADCQYDNFVRGLPSMLITTLAGSEKIVIVERLQIDKALRALSLEQSALVKEETAIQVGEWLGADIVVLGNFTEFGGSYRTDARLIDVKTGKILVAQHVTGNRNNIVEKIDELCNKILQDFIDEEINPEKPGMVEIKFRLTHATLTQRPIYYQICKLSIDGTYIGLGPAIRMENEWVTMFTVSLAPGNHDIKIRHGYLDESEDTWIGDFDQQPKLIDVNIETNKTTLIQYEYHTGYHSDEFRYIH